MAAPLSSASALDEAPLLSTGFLYRTTAVVGITLALTVAIAVGGRWMGERIALGGHTDSTAPITVTVGADTLRLQANTIRFPVERTDGPAERIDLYLTWPQMQGYSEADNARFNDVSNASSLIFLQLSQSTMSRDMSGRLEPIYSHLIEGAPFAGPHGLTAHHLRADAGYSGETLLTAPRSAGEDYVVRCVLPQNAALATSGDCQRDIRVGKDLSVLYRFSSASLGDWEHIDASIRTFVETRLVKAPLVARGRPPTDQ